MDFEKIIKTNPSIFDFETTCFPYFPFIWRKSHHIYDASEIRKAIIHHQDVVIIVFYFTKCK